MSARIKDEWTRNPIVSMTQRDGEVVAQTKVACIAAAIESALPEALVTAILPGSS
jgi:hypothetical protein